MKLTRQRRIARPFLKWAGGKGQLLEPLETMGFFPESFGRYYEPFLGGGAVFFYLWSTGRVRDAVLSDINRELIEVYRCVRDESKLAELITLLEEHQAKHYESGKEYYYWIRDEYEPATAVEGAARLIYLNKTCFNGLYRVNRKGRFNVPMGRYKRPRILDREALQSAHEALQCAVLEPRPFTEIFSLYPAGHGDFVYYDPPYIPVSETASFTDYQSQDFGADEQRALADQFHELALGGVNVLLNNSVVQDTNSPFYGVYRYVRERCESAPHAKSEVIVTKRYINSRADRRTGALELAVAAGPWWKV